MSYPPPRPTAPNGPGHCPRCLQRVIWCVNANQNTQAVDPDRNPNGNQAVHQDRTGRWLTRQLNKDRPTPEGAEQLHMPHAATCRAPAPSKPRPTAPRHRRGVRPSPQWRQR